MSNSKKTTRTRRFLLDMVYISMFAAIICICSLISINIGTVPVTLQTFAVCVCAAMLGMKRGALSVIIYILLGAVGLPVFAGAKGGFGVILGPTGGYIVGFIFTALIVGLSADRLGRRVLPLIISMIVGVLVCYAVGTPWFMVVTGNSLEAALGFCVLPFLIPDGIKIALAVLISNRLGKIIKL